MKSLNNLTGQTHTYIKNIKNKENINPVSVLNFVEKDQKYVTS